jgi:hypothetical protein
LFEKLESRHEREEYMNTGQNENKKQYHRKKIPRTLRATVLGVLAIFLLYSAVSAYTAYQTPTMRKVTTPVLHYEHVGRYDYIATLKNNTIYNNKTTLRPGEGIFFKQLITQVNASFSYTFQITQSADIAGNYSVDAILQTNLWKKTYPLIPRTPFNASGRTASFTTSFPLDYISYEQLLANMNEETGVPAQNPLLLIQSTIVIFATTGNETISSFFSPSINVSLNQKTLEISKDLISNLPGALTNSITVNRPEISTQRILWPIVSLGIVVGMCLFDLLTTNSSGPQSQTDKDIRKIKKKYGEWIVETKTHPEILYSHMITIDSLEDLAKVGEELGKPILLYTGVNNTAYRFYVLDDTTMYEYVFKPKEVSTQNTTLCPKCGTKIKYETYPGNRLIMVCPTCGNTDSISLEKQSKPSRTKLFFSAPNKKD